MGERTPCESLRLLSRVQRGGRICFTMQLVSLFLWLQRAVEIEQLESVLKLIDILLRDNLYKQL
jgi:hypothetical protein